MALPVREPSSAAASSRSSSRMASSSAPAPSPGDVTCDEHAGERDVLVLVDVAEFVVGGESAFGGPFELRHRGRRVPVAPAPVLRRRGARAGRSRCRRGAPLPRSVRARRRGRRGRGTVGPWRRASDRRAAGVRRTRRARCSSPGGGLAASRSLRSMSTSLNPTCMSAAPRSPGCSVVQRSPESKVRLASVSLPCAIWMSANAREHPSMSGR